MKQDDIVEQLAHYRKLREKTRADIERYKGRIDVFDIMTEAFEAEINNFNTVTAAYESEIDGLAFKAEDCLQKIHFFEEFLKT